MSTDLRGFAYPLEVLLRQAQWELDALQGKLGQVLREERQAQQSLDLLREEQERTAATGVPVAHQTFDPQRARHALAYLAALRQRMARQQQMLDRIAGRRDELQNRCIARQRHLELLQGHRQECLGEYVKERQLRDQTEADRDWLARSHWRSLASSGSETQA